MTGDSKIVGIRPQHNVTASGSGKGRGKSREPAPAPEIIDDNTDTEAPKGGRMATVAVLAIALVWTLLAGVAFWGEFNRQNIGLGDVTQFITGWATPLILLALMWDIAQRSHTGTQRRFAAMVARLQAEEARLAETLGNMGQRLDANRDAWAGQADLISQLGADTVERLSEATRAMQGQIDTLNRHAATLAARTADARSDMAGLLTDIPRAQTDVDRFAEALTAAGQSATAATNELAAQLALLAERGRSADDIATRSAQHLAERVAGLDDMTRIAAARIEEASQVTVAAVSAVLEQAETALAQARQALEAQGAEMVDLVEQSHSRIAASGIQATNHVNERVAEIGKRLAELGQGFAAQDAQSRTLLQNVASLVSDLETRLSALASQSDDSSAHAIRALQAVRDQADTLQTALETGSQSTQSLSDLAGDLMARFDAALRDINDALPRLHKHLEETAAAGSQAARAALPDLTALESASATALDRLRDAETLVTSQRDLIEQLVHSAGAALEESRATAQALTREIEAAEEQAKSLSGQASPMLIDALLRIKDTANQAAEHARTALDTIVPEAAQQLGEQARAALHAALSGPVEEQMAHIAARAEQAILAARQAATQLTSDVAAIDAAALGLEDRIEAAKDEAVRGDGALFARRMAQILDNLQGNAINVSKILDADITDTAWGAYLRGERGIFTRQAVRLISRGEAREIARLYRDDDDFRDQVNLYVHDFEAMLRNVMATRDSNSFSVALISSDAGKLYVALAQAIERLR